jgi:hypothetical protein
MLELWALQMGHCGHGQLSLLPKCVDGTPTVLLPHPFQFNDSKEQARVQKEPTGHNTEKAPEPKMRFFMDFGFMRSSRYNYCSPRLGINHVVECFEGYSVYLIIVDESSRYVWVFLRKSKEPPIDLVQAFLAIHSSLDGAVSRINQGGELARSTTFRTKFFRLHDTWWNLLVQTVHCKMAELRSGTTLLQSQHVPFSMALDYEPNTGQQPSSMPHTCITGTYMR